MCHATKGKLLSFSIFQSTRKVSLSFKTVWLPPQWLSKQLFASTHQSSYSFHPYLPTLSKTNTLVVDYNDFDTFLTCEHRRSIQSALFHREPIFTNSVCNLLSLLSLLCFGWTLTCYNDSDFCSFRHKMSLLRNFIPLDICVNFCHISIQTNNPKTKCFWSQPLSAQRDKNAKHRWFQLL